MRRLEKKAKDAGNADSARTKNDNWREIVTKPGNLRQTAIPRVKDTRKPGKRPPKEKQQVCETQLAPELEQTLEEGQDEEKGKGKTRGLSLYKAKKKWKD